MQINKHYLSRLDEITSELDKLTVKLDEIPVPSLTYEERYRVRDQIVQLCAIRNLMISDAAAEEKPKKKHFWQK